MDGIYIMKKKFLFIFSIIILFFIVISIYFIYSLPSGNTVESREKILNSSISKGEDWRILKEIEIDEYIISAGYSTDNKVTLAIFEPTKKGKYKFKSSTNRNTDDIIISGTNINGNWYDLIWFNGAKTEYAEITYTIDGNKESPIIYNTKDMDIIYYKNLAKDYSINVTYYDSYGNKYE